MKLIVHIALLSAFAGSAMADEVPLWKAHSGDVLILNDKVMSVRGVSCPPADTEAGLRAKRIANTFIRGRRVVCQVSTLIEGDQLVDCEKPGNDGVNLSDLLVQGGFCETSPVPSSCMAAPLDAMPTFLVPHPEADPGRLRYRSSSAIPSASRYSK
jgi:hypothetical protein